VAKCVGKFKMDTTHVHTNVSRTIFFCGSRTSPSDLRCVVWGANPISLIPTQLKNGSFCREKPGFLGPPEVSKKVLKPSSAVYDLIERSEAQEILGS
jgi:hypothetical protein